MSSSSGAPPDSAGEEFLSPPPALPRSENHGFNLRYQPPRVSVRLSKGTGR
ncbi:hypothetical protein Mal33_04860 [Rosistilla oblonga]|uniref:Uncharacterized protein n=1 Tax=Rosistilla oblonga TaxID=2527990 RepID=A0A518IN72_9BACT|nr:hypothetical protein Mal33_04860 [Rosistilla oblonga]